MKICLTLKVATLIIAIAIFIISSVYIYATYRWEDIVPILKQAKLLYLIGGGAISIVAYWLLRTMRFFLLLKSLDIKVSFVSLYMCSAVSLGFAIITPFQSGEALKIELLKRYGIIERIPGYSSFAMERAIDLFVIITLAVISILNVFDIGANKLIIIFIWAFILFFLGCVILAIKNINRIKKLGTFGEFIYHMKMSVCDLRTLFLVVILTFFSWIVIAIGWQICLYSISEDIGFQKAIALTSIVTTINIFSLIPGAIGVSEASIAEFLIRIGLEPTSAQAGSLILRIYGIMMLILSVFHLLILKLLRY